MKEGEVIWASSREYAGRGGRAKHYIQFLSNMPVLSRGALGTCDLTFAVDLVLEGGGLCPGLQEVVRHLTGTPSQWHALFSWHGRRQLPKQTIRSG